VLIFPIILNAAALRQRPAVIESGAQFEKGENGMGSVVAITGDGNANVIF